MDFETVQKIYKLFKDKDILDDILKLILESTTLSYDKTELRILDEDRIMNYIKLKFEDKYNERLAQLKNEKALEQEN
jgi:hypothetical protein